MFNVYILSLILSIMFLSNRCFSSMIDISLEKLYNSGCIDIANLMHDNDCFLKTDKDQNVILIKHGRNNKPFSLNLDKTTTVQESTEILWNNNGLHRITHLTCSTNVYSSNSLSVEPYGTYLINCCQSPSGYNIFIYSFSGYYKNSKGFGLYASTPSRKIGFNYFEIFNKHTQKNIFRFQNISFSKKYYPIPLFWLEKKHVIIFNNYYNRYLTILKY